MNGYMNKRYKAIHYKLWIDLGGDYLSPVQLCGWENPKHTSNSIKDVSCPDCLKKYEDIKEEI